MGVAISAVVAAVAVIYALSVTATTTQPVESILQTLLNIATGSGRILTTDEAVTALTYSVTIYLLVFSITYFFARFVGLVLVALGVADEQAIRAAREEKRYVRIQSGLLKRQAKLIARYLARSQAAVERNQAASERRQASIAKVFDTSAPPTETK